MEQNSPDTSVADVGNIINSVSGQQPSSASDQLPPGFEIDGNNSNNDTSVADVGNLITQSSAPSSDQPPPGFEIDSGGSDQPPPGFEIDQTPDYANQTGTAFLEGAAQGVVGPAAPWLEKNVLGINAQDILGRQQANPWAHGLGEAAGLIGGGAALPWSEGALVGKAGEAVAGLLGGAKVAEEGTEAGGVVSDVASLLSTKRKLAIGAAKAATEMGLFATSDELSKHVLGDPSQSIGSAVSNIGMSGLLGGITGGAFSAVGAGVSKILDKTGAADFISTIARLKETPDQVGAIQNEVQTIHDTIQNMGKAINGGDGIKDQMMDKLMPDLNPKMVKQAQTAAAAIKDIMETHGSDKTLQSMYDTLSSAANQSIDPFTRQPTKLVDPTDLYKTLNQTKRMLQSMSKPGVDFLNPLSAPKINAIRDASSDMVKMLEDSQTWGDVGTLQRRLNQAQYNWIPYESQFRTALMREEGPTWVASSDKAQAYLKKATGDYTSLPDRQRLIGKALAAAKNYQSAVADSYNDLNLENPFQSFSTSSLDETLDKPSFGTKMAYKWNNKWEGAVFGHAAGVATGAAVGDLVGHPGLGSILGERLLGPAFTGVVKAALEKFPTIDSGVFTKAYSMLQNVDRGATVANKALTGIFSANPNILPAGMIPSPLALARLDKKSKELQNKPEDILNLPGNLATYLPNHAAQISQTASMAVNYLNSVRPNTVGTGLLDGKRTPSASELSQYNRTLKIAEQPLTVLQHIKQGNLTTRDIQDLKAMYPGYYDYLSQQLMSKVIDMKAKGKPIPYALRQSIALFTGQTLDSTMTPSAIQAAQAANAPQTPPPAQMMPKARKPRGRLSALGDKTSSLYATPAQAADKDRQSRAK